MDLFQQQMNRKDEHVGHANQQYRATSAPEFLETRFVHHPFTTVDVADVTLQTKLWTNLRCSLFHQRHHGW